MFLIPWILLLASGLCSAQLGVPEIATAPEFHHSWQALSPGRHNSIDAPILQHSFEIRRLGGEIVILASEGVQGAPGVVPTAADKVQLGIYRLAPAGISRDPRFPSIQLPSGPYPGIALLGDQLLLGTSRHLILTDGTRTSEFEAPWPKTSCSPRIWREGGRVWLLSPIGTLYEVGGQARLAPVFPPGTPAIEQAVFIAPDRLWWLDERNTVHLGILAGQRRERQREPAPMRELFSCPLPQVRVGFFAADRSEAVALGIHGRLLRIRDGRVRFDSAEISWPRVDPVGLRLNADGTVAIADRCGWISTIDMRESRGLWDGFRTVLRWKDSFANGWGRTFEALAERGGDWVLRGAAACLWSNGGRLIEFRSGVLPYGLTPEAPPEDMLPYYERIPTWLLPRTIRSVVPGRRGLWVITSTSIDLLDLLTQRILERQELTPDLRAEAAAGHPFGGLEGGLIGEIEGNAAKGIQRVLFLRAPDDHHLIRIASASADRHAAPERTRFRAGQEIPPPPYNGMALAENGDLVLASRRGLFYLACGARRFLPISCSPDEAPRSFEAVVARGDRSFLALAAGRLWRWCPGDARARARGRTRGIHSLWREAPLKIAATDGHRIFQVEEDQLRPWPCEPTPAQIVIRSFGRTSERGSIVILDRENRLFLWERTAWSPLQVKEPLSEYSAITHVPGQGLFINLDASLWQLSSQGEFHCVLDYRVALARWVDQKGLTNVNFFFTTLLVGVLLFSLTGAIVLPKGPIPQAHAPLLPWDGLHVGAVLLVFIAGQWAIGGVFDLTELRGYPVLRASLAFALPGLLSIWLTARILQRHYRGGLNLVGLPRLRTGVAMQQFLLGLLMVVPVAIIAGGLSGILARLGAAPMFFEQSHSPLIPMGDGERLAIFLSIAVVAPIVEEVVFRGFLQTVLVDRWGAFFGITATAVIFAGIHPFGGYAPIFVLALALGLARQATGNLFICFGLHLAQNFVPALAIALST